jgi:hypothetical protein
VTFLFSHEGAAACEAGCPPRNREGRKLEAMLAIVARPEGRLERTIGGGEAWGGWRRPREASEPLERARCARNWRFARAHEQRRRRHYRGVPRSKGRQRAMSFVGDTKGRVRKRGNGDLPKWQLAAVAAVVTRYARAAGCRDVSSLPQRYFSGPFRCSSTLSHETLSATPTEVVLSLRGKSCGCAVDARIQRSGRFGRRELGAAKCRQPALVHTGGKFPVRRAGDNVELGDRRNLDRQFDFNSGRSARNKGKKERNFTLMGQHGPPPFFWSRAPN